jgi:hypothetical protein
MLIPLAMDVCRNSTEMAQAGSRFYKLPKLGLH